MVSTRPELLPVGLTVHPEPVFVLPGRMWLLDDILVVPDHNHERALIIDLSIFRRERVRGRASSGHNKQGHVAKVYFPAEDRHAAIIAKDFNLPSARRAVAAALRLANRHGPGGAWKPPAR